MLTDHLTTLKKKGIDIQGLVASNYEEGPSSGICKGQIVWMPAFYPDRNKENIVIDIDVASDPTETAIPAFLRPISQKKNHFPVKSLNLGSHEHAFVVRGKIRPSIVIVNEIVEWGTSPPQNLALCVPLYTVEKQKIRQNFVLKSQAFQYASKFYLPPDFAFRIEESIARFELIQCVHHFGLSPFVDSGKPVMLTEDFFELLRIQLTRFLEGKLNNDELEMIEVYGQIILEEVKRQGITL